MLQWGAFGSRKAATDGSRNFDGYENIRRCQAYFQNTGTDGRDFAGMGQRLSASSRRGG